MKVTVNIDTKGVEALIQAETRKWVFWTKKSSFEVGYDAYYAIYVHEDLRKTHRNGQAKFLEDAVNRWGPRIESEIQARITKGDDPPTAIRQGAERLLLLSQSLVPVLTGFLRSSGYVRQA